jgi:ABC-type sugar transport system permease subunit
VKKAKQLLWFIIPTVYIWFSIIFTAISVKNNTPKFLRTTNYCRLFFKDAVLKKALLNTFLFPALIALLCCAALYAAKRLINRKYNIKYINAVFYAVVSVLTTACMFFRIKRVFAYPANTYLAAVLQAEPKGSNFNLFLLCLQAAVLLCFIFWCIDLVSEKINGRK